MYGESVSLRLLTRGKISLSLDKLGFLPHEEAAIREIIVKPHGIFLVTGRPVRANPRRSTPFSVDQLGPKRIITIEEPVEYELKGINQIAVRPEIGLTFAMGLRHILRQDPNVVMVGEIRDLETAEIAIRAALTGHLVFSTLHTNDAPSAFTRLIDMASSRFWWRPRSRPSWRNDWCAPSARSANANNGSNAITSSASVFRRRKLTPRVLARRRLRGMPQLGYQGRTGIYELLIVNESCAVDHEPRARLDHRPEGHRKRHAHPARGRLDQGQKRRHDHRGSAAGHPD